MKSERGLDEIARSLYEAVKSYSAYVGRMRSADASTAVPAPAAPVAEKGASAASAGAGYAVQLLASRKEVPLRSSRFKEYRGQVKQYISEGPFRYKYCVGLYTDRAAAQRRLKEVRRTFPDAFVVRCEGERIVK